MTTNKPCFILVLVNTHININTLTLISINTNTLFKVVHLRHQVPVVAQRDVLRRERQITWILPPGVRNPTSMVASKVFSGTSRKMVSTATRQRSMRVCKVCVARCLATTFISIQVKVQVSLLHAVPHKATVIVGTTFGMVTAMATSAHETLTCPGVATDTGTLFWILLHPFPLNTFEFV